MTFPTLEFSSTNVDAVALLGAAGREERGGVYTKQEVVDFILDLVGYTSDQQFIRQTIYEESSRKFSIIQFPLTDLKR